MFDQIYQGHVLELAETLPSNSINCIVTSPPYFNLRSYGGKDVLFPEVIYAPLFGMSSITIPEMTCQLGREKTIEAYIGHMVAIFRVLRVALRDDGVLWVNIGDSYAVNLPPKNLCGIPWRFALAMQADGWILRSDVIWEKTNGLPESVRDRPTKGHEYLFLFSKQERYWYDQTAIRKEISQSTKGRWGDDPYTKKGEKYNAQGLTPETVKGEHSLGIPINGPNRRSVWPMPTANYKGSHYAVMPSEMAELCILAGCPAEVCSTCGGPYEQLREKTGFKAKRKPAHCPDRSPTQISSTGWKPASRATNIFESVCECNASARPGVVLDPFMGSGTVAEAAIKLRRQWLGFDADPACIRLTNERINGTQISLNI